MGRLFFRELGESNHKPLVILHGLFGSSDNWLTLGKRFAEQFHVYLVDQRNHGHSFHDSEFNYQAMANDLYSFFQDQNLNSSHLLGHSMGGKTAMEFAIQFPERIDKLIIADIGPKSYPVHHHTILEGLFAIDLNSLQSRRDADTILSEYVKEIGVRQFLLKNLTRGEKGFKWRVNLEVIADQIEEVGKGLIENSLFNQPTYFIRGGRSEYILDQDFDMIKSIFSDAQIATIPNVGHWLHAEQPEKFYELTTEFLTED